MVTKMMTQKPLNLFTIGFAGKSAADFFTRLKDSGIKRVIDIRLHPDSQLAGFAKQSNLSYFLKEIVAADYIHLPELAPTPELFNSYKKLGGPWVTYEMEFLELMSERRIEDKIDPGLIAGGCLLCSEHQPHHCHRRLVAEYLKEKWNNMEIKHLE